MLKVQLSEPEETRTNTLQVSAMMRYGVFREPCLSVVANDPSPKNFR